MTSGFSSTRTPRADRGRARLIGYSPSAAAVLVVILVHREDRPGAWWGANGWRVNSTDRRTYQQKIEERDSDE